MEIQPGIQPDKMFDSRKEDHINLSLDPRSQADTTKSIDAIKLVHEALPEVDFEDIDIGISLWGHDLKAPLFVSSMTAGHKNGEKINATLAHCCEKRGWLMGVGSQRKQLFDPNAKKEWELIRRHSPGVKLMGNVGMAQLIETPLEAIQELVHSIGAIGLFVHTNPLQEALQSEGTPKFKGSLKALEKLCVESDFPVVLKETGCGISTSTFKKIKDLPLSAVDVSGYGGTHWGVIEGLRAPLSDIRSAAWVAFKDWGIDTVTSLKAAMQVGVKYPVWASGGLRSGVDAAKVLALGAQMAGFAQPILQAAVKSPDYLLQLMELYEFELKTSLFCTGSQNLAEFGDKQPWQAI